MSRQSVAVTLVTLLGVQLALVAYFAGWFEGKPTTSADSGSGGEPEQLPPEPKRRESLPGFFAQLAEARQSNNVALMVSLHDSERWADEVMAALRREKTPAPPGFRDRLTGAAGGTRSISQSLLPPWTEVRIDWQSYRELPTAGEAEVLVSHRLRNGSDYHMHWWLKYGKQGWRYFDWEDRELDERFSTGTAQTPKFNPAEADSWVQGAMVLSQAEDAAQTGRMGDALVKLSLVAGIKFPTVLEAHRWLLTGIVALHGGKPEKAVEAFDKAEDFRKPIPYTDRLRAEAYLKLGESGRALSSLARYTERLGEDPRTACCRGAALMMLAQLPRAVRAFRECLEDAPRKDQRAGPIKTNGAQK